MANINEITLLDANKPDKVKEKINEIIHEVVNYEPTIPTKEDIGLGEVDNTSDMDKPLSTAQKDYIDSLDENNLKKDSADVQELKSDIAIHNSNKLFVTRSSGDQENGLSIDNSDGQENVLIGSFNVPLKLQHATLDISGNNVGRNPKVNVREIDGEKTTERIAFVSDIEEAKEEIEEEVILIDNKVNNLKDKVDGINAMNRYLAIWNCEIGAPTTEPTTLPYTYQNGDYYIIGKVSETVNYRPVNSPTYNGDPSTVVETGEPKVNDLYIYDGSVFNLMERNSIIMENIRKADKVEGAVENNLAGLDTNGNLKDSGISKEEVEAAIDHAEEVGNPHNTTFSELENKPTSLAGYGITDAYTKNEIDGMFADIQDAFDNLADLLEGV